MDDIWSCGCCYENNQWRKEEDARTIIRYKEIMDDPKRKADAEKVLEEKLAKMKKDLAIVSNAVKE